MALCVHAAIGTILISLPPPSALSGGETPVAVPDTRNLPRMVFVAPPNVPPGGGGGGGGNRLEAPAPRAQAPGPDLLTVPVTRPPAPKTTAPELPQEPQQLVLDSQPLASGMSFLAGLPDAGPSRSSVSRGPGSGGGFGEGEGSGIGSGTGPGAGPGTSGGVGGGAYRVGGAVSAPVLLSQVRPSYTDEALSNRIQGAVELELVVRRNGEPDAIRVVRSLDPGGLDVEAIRAVRRWRFRPGRVGDQPVDVFVTVVVNFSLH